MSNHTATIHTRPVIQPVDEATKRAVLGGSITVRLRREETGGRLGLIEQVVPGGYPGPAMHVHPEFDETFYVVDGTLAFRVGDHAYEAGPGLWRSCRGARRTRSPTPARSRRDRSCSSPRGVRKLLRGADRADQRDGRTPARAGASRPRDRARQHPRLTESATSGLFCKYGDTESGHRRRLARTQDRRCACGTSRSEDAAGRRPGAARMSSYLQKGPLSPRESRHRARRDRVREVAAVRAHVERGRRARVVVGDEHLRPVRVQKRHVV